MNVHPTKQEVRFQDGGRLYSQLLGTLRTKFLTTDLTARGATPTSATAFGRRRGGRGDVPARASWCSGRRSNLGKQVRASRVAVAAADSRRRGRPGSPMQLPTSRCSCIGFDAPAFEPFDIGQTRKPIASSARPSRSIACVRARPRARGSTTVGASRIATQRAAGSQSLPGRRNRRRHRGDRPARAARADSVRAASREGAWPARSNRSSCWCPSRSI